MTTLDQAEAAYKAEVLEAAPRRGRRRGGNWWRYLVSLLAIAFAVFPILYVVSSAFNPVDSLSGSGLIPDDVTLDNFRKILSGSPGEEGTSEEALDVPYKNWYVNMLFVSGQAPVDKELRIVGDTFEEQTRVVFEAFGIVLKEAGFAWSDVAKINAFVSEESVEALETYGAILKEYLSRHADKDSVAHTYVVVKQLALPGVMLELEGTAVRA